jgi:uncharacterized protein YwqG
MKHITLLGLGVPLTLFVACLAQVYAQSDIASSPKTTPSAVQAISPAQIKEYLAPWLKAIDGSRSEVVLFALEPGKDSPWRSKIGGVPYLPKGASLPKDVSGSAMYLLAQVNFDEVPHLTDYPQTGMLQFFIAADDFYGANFSGDSSEAALMEQRNFRVVFYPTVLKDPASLEVPKLVESDELPFNPAVPLLMSFTKETETINADDIGFEAVFGMSFYPFAEQLAKKHGVDENALVDALSDYLGPNDFHHKIGGYPSFTQEDPRDPRSKLRLLFQVSSDDAHKHQIMWGDSGIAGFFIDPADLKRADFRKVMYSWDCY